MKILALDSSASVASVALCENDSLVSEFSLCDQNKHSETLLPMLESMLKLAGIDLSEVDLFAVSNGPGSFTGIRIGISLIKGLAFGSGKPCIGVPTLEALAYNLTGSDGLICPVMDARREQVYHALFSMRSGIPTRLCEDRLIPVKELCAELKHQSEPIYLVGDGYDMTANLLGLPENLPGNFRVTPPTARLSHAVSVARAAKVRYDNGQSGTDSELLPVYLRASQAERERLERMSEQQKK
ncbi:MAG: tRNA (adenosine(37)-N6)-threonylcarbamoyltransferase complex dimerization subunit type 1 TsaB [Eubacteriales bacterium]